MAPNKLTDDEIRRFLQQIKCQSDCYIDDNDIITKFKEDGDEDEIQTEMEMETVTKMKAFPIPEEVSGEGETTEEGLEISAPIRRGKIITRKRTLCLIDSALDPDNYNEFKLPTEEQTIKSIICKKTKRDPEINIIWLSVPPTNHKTTAENIISS